MEVDMGIEKILFYYMVNRLRSTHCREILFETMQTHAYHIFFNHITNIHNQQQIMDRLYIILPIMNQGN